MSRILVTGATGTVGRQVIAQFAAEGVSVRAFARNPDVGRLPRQVDVVRGDLTIPETLDAAMDGIDSVFLVWVAPPATIGPVLGRIARRARRIVFLSAPLKTPHPFFQQPNPIRELSAAVERGIEASGLQWTFLRPGMFAANALRWWAPPIRAGGVVRWPYLAAAAAPIDERDIAAVAVRALCEDNRHTGAEYVLTGPQSLTQLEQISAIGRVIGRPLRIEDIPPEEARRAGFAGMPGIVVNMLLDAWAASLGQPAFLTSTVAEITGRPARPFDQWAADHAAAFRA